MTSEAQHKAIEEIVVAIGLDVVYFEHDEFAHFDPISLTATVAAVLLTGFFEGVVDAVRNAGRATATRLARRLGEVHEGRQAPDLPIVDFDDVARYGDVAQSVVQAALVEHGFPLRKAAALAESVRRSADAVAATDTQRRTTSSD
jgi:hypothetical protein